MKELKKLKVKILQEDIKGAVRGKSNKCMIQHAIHREYPHLQHIWVDYKNVRVTDPKTNAIYTFNMTPFGRVQLLKFDSGEHLEEFTLRVSKPVVRYRTINRSKTGYKQVPAGQREADQDKTGGTIRTPRTAKGRRMIGRDRVFGARLHHAELRKLRESLEITPNHPELQIA